MEGKESEGKFVDEPSQNELATDKGAKQEQYTGDYSRQLEQRWKTLWSRQCRA